jgi:uncharacterized membrane protein (Fun14 family)
MIMRTRVKVFCFIQALSVATSPNTWSDPKDPLDSAGIVNRAKVFFDSKRDAFISKVKNCSNVSLKSIKEDIVAEFQDFPVLMTANEIGEGFLIGLFAGFFVKKTTKVVAFITGGVLLCMEGLRLNGVQLPDLSERREAIEQFLKEKNIDVSLPVDCLKEVPTLSSVIKTSDRNIRRDMGIVSGAAIALLYF